MRLRPTLVGLLVVLALVLSSTVYVGFALYQDDVAATERSGVDETAETTARTLESRLASNERVVRVGAADTTLGAHGTVDQETALHAFRRESTFDAVSVVARDGTVTAFSAADMNESEQRAVVGRDRGDRTYVRASLNGSSYVGEPVVTSSGNSVVVISAPIRNETGVVGTLNAAFHLTSTSSNRAALFGGLGDSTERAQTISVEGRNETLYGVEHAEGRTYHASEPVAGTDWVVTAHSDRSATTSRLRTVTLVQGGALLVVLCLVGTVGFWTYRTNIEQITELRATLTALEAGDYDVDVTLQGSEEWDEIEDRFERVGTRLEQRESQLRVLNRVFRHNLRNEMNVVLGHSRSVTRDDADVAAHAAAIESAARDTLDMSQHTRMIEDRLNEGSATREPGAIDAVVDDAIDAADVVELADVSVDVPTDAVVVDGDGVATAVGEVLANAIVHNPARPGDCSVSVTATDRDAHVRVTVSDDGPGLPDVERDVLAGELDASPVNHGEGLGLWIARWLVERADGTIEVTVTDDGTTVTMTLPKVYVEDR